MTTVLYGLECFSVFKADIKSLDFDNLYSPKIHNQ